MNSPRRPSRIPAALCTVTVTVLAGAAMAVAAVPDQAGTIHSCRKASGAIRVVDSEAAQTCARDETTLAWDQHGPSVTYVRSKQGTNGKASAQCDVGDVATGGGVETRIHPPTAVWVSKPVYGLDEKPVGWSGILTDASPIEVFAVCADVRR